MTIDLWLVATSAAIVLLAIVATLSARSAWASSRAALGGFSARAGHSTPAAALVAHGEFTIILAQLAAGTPS